MLVYLFSLKTYQKVNFVFELKQLYLKMFIIVILLLSHGHGGRKISTDRGGMWLYPSKNQHCFWTVLRIPQNIHEQEHSLKWK